jgi:rhomboid-like protein
MLFLYSFGSSLAEVLPASRLLGLYFGCGIVGSLAYVAYQKWIAEQRRNARFRARMPSVPALGASGANMGLAVVFAWLFPSATINVFFFLPIPARLAVAGLIGYDIYGAWSDAGAGSRVAQSGHIGGAFAGLAYALLRLR